MAEVQYISDGFMADCRTLLSKFAETNSARFSDFVRVWQEMKFPTIFCGLNTFAELLEFTEEALSISKQLFLPPNPEISRIGALYLIYGVYTQQPTRGLVKIRMTPDDWYQTITFIDSVREFGYDDANYIFHSLCYNAAFTFTACSREYGLERTYRRHQISFGHMQEMLQYENFNTNQLLKPVFEDIDVDQFENVRANYEECKRVLAQKDESQGMLFTPVVPLEDIVTSLRNTVDPILATENVSSANTARTSGATGINTDDGASKDVGKGRQALKKRAFQHQGSGQKHLKSCLSPSEDVETPPEEPSTSEPPESKTRKKEPERKNFFCERKRQKKKVVSEAPLEEKVDDPVGTVQEERVDDPLGTMEEERVNDLLGTDEERVNSPLASEERASNPVGITKEEQVGDSVQTIDDTQSKARKAFEETSETSSGSRRRSKRCSTVPARFL